MPRKPKAVQPVHAAQHCGNCRFFRATEDGGKCHLNPPAMFAEGDSLYAVHTLVEADDWCGQHQFPIQ